MTNLNVVRPERALEDQVVEGHEADLRGEVAGRGDERSWACDQRLVEDLAEGGRDLLAGALDVRGDRSPASATTSSWKRA